MYNAGKIIIGILIFLGLFSFPIWYGAVRSGPPPKLELPKQAKQCVQTTAFMKSSHMELLNDWRNEVVRDGRRIYVGPDGKEYKISLENTCMKCHTSKTKFCDRCHDYMHVTPKCWDCHLQPEEKAPEGSK